MSLDQALNRAAYRHTVFQANCAEAHYVRSGRIEYLRRAAVLSLRASAIEPLCNFR